MSITKETIIGELVANDYRAASVFKKYKLDFCCQGNRTIGEACELKSVDANALVSDLIATTQNVEAGAIDFQTWPLDLLADYIQKKHHRYVEEKSLEIKPYLDKICRVHGPHHPELFEINEHFTATAGELAMHMKKEELILFPFIKKMEKAKQEGTGLEMPPFGSVQNPIDMMMHEHTTEGERFRKIEELTNNYNPPAEACNTYRVTFALLKEFEADLHLHIHLENNILFPKAIEMEKTFR
ncbi:MAG TPA: iron-sulfur cluster repair di-iron protein [Chitinophagales bacterium]|nr:iron-sulfur cluster repair di-iron protein [Chitinophagales bacterium]HMX59558.1 iron-sulfur cluster repair di-iron protein [Chitinophagales bacterium]HMZ33019.1 iron-sulfur cluster repair di-iron protein [Chitinophagales bacterium]HNA38767.1 iron-sulfur cluster repair di-iron protein [Chitinophagales bacterium]HNB48793.1 iron-sulfur cluster repair di-iron protein [Chitinophagales bacterium]